MEFGEMIFGTVIGVFCLSILPIITIVAIGVLFKIGKTHLAILSIGASILVGLFAATLFVLFTWYDPPIKWILFVFIWVFGITSFLIITVGSLISELINYIKHNRSKPEHEKKNHEHNI